MMQGLVMLEDLVFDQILFLWVFFFFLNFIFSVRVGGVDMVFLYD